MLPITANNVNDAYHEGLWRMRILGVESDSRNGKVKRIPGPVATTYKRPEQRMLLDPRRDANPFFHIFEGIWMLAGRNDVKWISQFNSHIASYSDDSATFHGAYGHRWREHWQKDQLIWIIEHLRKNPTSRRAVMAMYDPIADQWDKDNEVPLDIPCNTTVYFGISGGTLNMTVCCRSNDMIWGCYGANAVHMSMLQEFVARALGINVGWYVQFSNDFHIYERHFDLLNTVPSEDYTKRMIEGHEPLIAQGYWGRDIIQFEQWLDAPDGTYNTPYIQRVLRPMLRTWRAYKMGDREQAMVEASFVRDMAVQMACVGWLERRKWA
jgi:thymidylate synthase